MNGQQSFDPYQISSERTVKVKEIYDDLAKRRTSISNQPVDHNSATHLIRYALGKDHILLSNYLNAASPRNIRDDISLTIVYFDTEYIATNYN